MTLAVADDAATMRAAFARVAALGGHAISGEAADAPSALALYERERPGVLVVDSRLPPHGALAFLDALFGRFPEANVLVIASLGEVELVRAAVARGARGALRRPFDPREVLATLERAAASGA